MRRSTIQGAVAGGVLALSVLAGCGGDSSESGDTSAEETTAEETSAEGTGTEEYCTQLEDTQESIQSLEEGDPTQFAAAFEAFRGLAEVAPEEVAADWDTLVSGVDQLEAALEDVGLTLEEFGQIAADPSQLPDDVDAQKLQELGPKLEELNSPEFDRASDAISTHAEEECGVTLDNGGQTPTEEPSQ